ncbi:hypothetical protein ZWY2020_056846 [Hordeum vulgare]|nr:hypothetical protein ZWY2020_056846 [Hordeum vulgare]
MAVQARFLSHAFPHDLNAYRSMDAAASQSQFLDDHAGCAPAVACIGNSTVLSDLPRSELTCNDNYGFVPRKRPRVMAGDEPAGLDDLARQRLVLQQAAAMHGLVLPCDAQSRAVCSGAASTSGRMANAAGLNTLLYDQGVEMDALIRLETERIRSGLEEARRRHARAVLATVERAAAGRLHAVEAELERARYRNGELEERLRQMTAEGQAWLGVAKSHEAVAAGLRATLDQLLQPPCAVAGAVEGDADDAQSCCFETPAGDNADDAAAMHGLVLPCDAQSRAVCSGAASTSGRMANAAGLNTLLYDQGVEMDALIRLETERIRSGLEEARRRHARAVLATVERAAAGRLHAVEAELERARYRNGELEERLRQMTAEGQAWLGVAKSHEAVAAGLRATLDQLLQPPCAVAGAVEGDADDAQSCCFETPAGDNADDAAAPSCKACGQRDACVLLLPCRHLSLCGACEPSVDTCPVCAATKNASLHVLLS